MHLGKILGVDYGSKRVGIAISDESRTFAFPKIILKNDKDFFKKIKNIIEEEKVKEVVVGESVDYSGKPNKISKNIETFIEKLKDGIGLIIHTQKEFMTSVEARRLKSGKMNKNLSTTAHSRIKKEKMDKVDAVAAALILERFLAKK